MQSQPNLLICTSQGLSTHKPLAQSHLKDLEPQYISPLLGLAQLLLTLLLEESSELFYFSLCAALGLFQLTFVLGLQSLLHL